VVSDAGTRGVICRSGWQEALPEPPATLSAGGPDTEDACPFPFGDRARFGNVVVPGG